MNSRTNIPGFFLFHVVLLGRLINMIGGYLNAIRNQLLQEALSQVNRPPNQLL
jgi:hypothetical protein